MNQQKKMLLQIARSEYMLGAENAEVFKTFLKEKKITSKTALELGIGYAGTSDALSKLLQTEENLWPVAEELGLIRIKDGEISDKFRDRIMFSLNDQNGCCVGFIGFAMNRPPKYLSTISTFTDHPTFIYGIEGFEFIKKKGVVLVVEGLADYLALYEKGILNVVCTLGRMMSDEQIKELHKIASEIILGLDQDERGKKATTRIAQKMIDFGVKPYSIDYGQYMNAKEFMENESEAVKKMKEKMSLADPIG